jgi:type II secretion system protein D
VLKPREDQPLADSRGAGPVAVQGEGASVNAAPAVAASAAITGTELSAVPDERQQLAITVDSRTNSLIVSGTPTYLDLVEQVVNELDSLQATEREVYVYQLRNAVADEVARVVGGFVESEQKKLVATLGSDQIGSAARLLEREITIQGDTQSNTVLVSASPRYMDRVKEMIRKLDVDPPQVLIQVMLAEVTLDSRDQWGVNMQAMFDIGSATVTGGYGLARGFVNGLGVPSLAITSDDFSLLIRALQSQGRLQVLSNPSIMAANNSPARIQVGETIQVPTSSSISSAGNVFSTVASEDIGVILEVTPSINPDGFVRMTINPEISNLSNRTTQISEDFSSPIITRRRADTTVTVHDGQTIVLGGLISDRFEKRDRKVPLLGDIPLLGKLFRADSEDTATTELLIVLTPHVIESPTNFSRVTELTQEQIDRLSVPPSVKESIRKGILEGTGGLYDAQGNRIDVKELEKAAENP